MSALGAIGAIGGTAGASAYTASPAKPSSDPAAAPTSHWFAKHGVMDTAGDVNGSEVTLDDRHLGRPGVGTLERERPDQRIALPALQPARPTAAVVNQVASIYAANRVG